MTSTNEARHFLELTDLSVDELRQVLELGRRSPESLGRPLWGSAGSGGVALIFSKPSNRTRQSMEMAVVQLGGHPVYTRGEEVGFDVREPVEDVTRILCGYHSMLAARVFEHDTLTRMAAVATAPVVNMLSDRAHPLQALADLLSMTEVFGPLHGCTVAYVGDYNNVARSLAEGCAMLGAAVRLGCPVGFDADEVELERLRGLGEATVEQFRRPEDAVAGAHAVHTDTWTSMGQEAEKQARVRAFEGYTVTQDMMALAAPDAVFLHCLPAYRGLEVAADVIDGPRSIVIRQGHQRLHAARGLLAFLLGVRP